MSRLATVTSASCATISDASCQQVVCSRTLSHDCAATWLIGRLAHDDAMSFRRGRLATSRSTRASGSKLSDVVQRASWTSSGESPRSPYGSHRALTCTTARHGLDHRPEISLADLHASYGDRSVQSSISRRASRQDHSSTSLGRRIDDLTFAVPPLAEQRGIAATLGALDDKIESNRSCDQRRRDLLDADLARPSTSRNRRSRTTTFGDIRRCVRTARRRRARSSYGTVDRADRRTDIRTAAARTCLDDIDEFPTRSEHPARAQTATS